MSLRATRLCLMSPTIAILSPSKLSRRFKRGPDRVAVEQRLGRVGVPPVAGVDHAGVRPLARPATAPRSTCGGSRTHRRPSPRSSRSCRAGSRPCSRWTTTPRSSSCRPTAAWRPSRSSAGSGSSPRRTRCRPSCRGAPAPSGSGRRLTSAMWSARSSSRRIAVDAGFVDRAEVLHEIVTPSAVAATCSSVDVGRFLPTKSGRIGSSRWPRSTSTASCTAFGPAVVGDRVEGGLHGATGEEHVVDEHDGRPVDLEVDLADAAWRHGPQTDVVAVQRGVDRADRNDRGRCVRSRHRASRRATHRLVGGRSERHRRGRGCAR